MIDSPMFPSHLALFNEQSRCVKCGHTDAAALYEAWASRLMRRTCQRCGHQWCEAPLDSAPDPLLAAALAEVDKIAP